MQLRGFGMTMDLERGTMRSWVVGGDGVKRWADTNAPVDPPKCPYCTSDNDAVRETYFDQTCAGCVTRMTHNASFSGGPEARPAGNDS